MFAKLHAGISFKGIFMKTENLKSVHILTFDELSDFTAVKNHRAQINF